MLVANDFEPEVAVRRARETWKIVPAPVPMRAARDGVPGITYTSGDFIGAAHGNRAWRWNCIAAPTGPLQIDAAGAYYQSVVGLENDRVRIVRLLPTRGVYKPTGTLPGSPEPFWLQGVPLWRVGREFSLLFMDRLREDEMEDEAYVLDLNHLSQGVTKRKTGHYRATRPLMPETAGFLGGPWRKILFYDRDSMYQADDTWEGYWQGFVGFTPYFRQRHHVFRADVN